MEKITQNPVSPVELPNIAVELLQYQNKDYKVNTVERVHRVDNQNQNRTGDCTKIRSKERDNVGYTHNHADQCRIRCLHNTGTDKAEQTNNNGI